jgi:hypothetical protein
MKQLGKSAEERIHPRGPKAVGTTNEDAPRPWLRRRRPNPLRGRNARDDISELRCGASRWVAEGVFRAVREDDDVPGTERDGLAGRVDGCHTGSGDDDVKAGTGAEVEPPWRRKLGTRRQGASEAHGVQDLGEDIDA